MTLHLTLHSRQQRWTRPRRRAGAEALPRLEGAQTLAQLSPASAEIRWHLFTCYVDFCTSGIADPPPTLSLRFECALHRTALGVQAVASSCSAHVSTSSNLSTPSHSSCHSTLPSTSRMPLTPPSLPPISSPTCTVHCARS